MKSLFRDLLITSQWSIRMSNKFSLEAILGDAEEREKKGVIGWEQLFASVLAMFLP
jgi:hypothetical protein